MLLAADVGGTKSLLGLFTADSPRPREVALRTYQTDAFSSFTAMLDRFAAETGRCPVEAAAAGVAGPVIHNRALITNIGWVVDARELAAFCTVPRAQVLNDLEAMASSIDALAEDEIEVLQAGVRDKDGNAAIIAAGTGLGVAVLHNVGGRLVPMATESGHADFSPRTQPEIELLRQLQEQFGRATVEHVLSGQGFVNIFGITHDGRCDAGINPEAPDAPARISKAGMERACERCADTLAIFVAAYGAEAGNLALRSLATRGVYIGGGIAPKILPVLKTGTFMAAFHHKAPMTDIVMRVPVSVILNEQAGLIGAAVAAREMLTA